MKREIWGRWGMGVYLVFGALTFALSGCGSGGGGEDLTVPATEVAEPDGEDYLSQEVVASLLEKEETVANEPEEDEARAVATSALAGSLDPDQVREAARDAGLKSLSEIPIPQVENLDKFLNPGRGAKKAAILLGKALFWDMQVGSDGQACGSCHFHAGADNRSRNQLTPGLNSGDSLFGNNTLDVPGFPQFAPDYTLKAEDFPFHVLENPGEENFNNRKVLFDTNDGVSSMGVFAANFNGVVPNKSADLGAPFLDGIFNILNPDAVNLGDNVRRVEPRNTPTMINAVFNHSNFWDGRAHNLFNGVSVIGPLDQNASIWSFENGRVVPRQVLIPNASLASQAVGPPLNDLEMSFFHRSFPDIGRKLLSLRPLGLQMVHPNDSALGLFSRGIVGKPGLFVSYRVLIMIAFRPEFWLSKTPDGVPLMEANFPLIFGLAVQMYESTLVSDRTPFDRFMEGDNNALRQDQLRGLLTFINTGSPSQVEGGNFGSLFEGVSKGNCIHCHEGTIFTSASVLVAGEAPTEVDFLAGIENGLLVKIDEHAFLDEGFYNIGVRSTEEDLGRGAEINGIPLSFTQQAIQGFDLPFAELPETDQVRNNRATTNGTFKVSGLRNVELTGPYFHNGGQATLAQVVEFYYRSGDFSDVNIDMLDGPLAEVDLEDGDEDFLVPFMVALTDNRVRNEKAPFDHPQILVPNGGTFANPQPPIEIPAVGRRGRANEGLSPLKPFLELNHLD